MLYFLPTVFRKAVRATAVLLPLFGLHWLVTLYRPSSSSSAMTGGCIWGFLHKYVIVILDGSQGLIVSIAFCYRNGEVSDSILYRYCWCATNFN